MGFATKGNIASFTAATSAPTSVQSTGPDSSNFQQYILVNTDSTIDAIIGWGATDSIAKANAAAGTAVTDCYYLQHSTTQVINGPKNAFFSGITGSSTAIVKVQCGFED